MIRRPRNLFRARMRGNAVYAGPEFVGPEPHYLACVDELVRRHGHQLVPGTVNEVRIFHDDDCAIFAGGPCDCEPDVELLKPEIGG